MALLLYLLLLPITMFSGLFAMRLRDQESRDKNLRAYDLAFPADLEVERVVAWLQTISGSLRPRFPLLQGTPTIVFELWSNNTGFKYRLLVPWQYGGGSSDQSDYIISQLRGMVPGINVTPQAEYPPRIRWRKAVEVGLRVPTRQLSIINPADVSNSLLNSLTSLNENETVVMQWVVTPATRSHKPIQGEARTHHATLKSAVSGNIIANPDEVRDRRDKLEEPNMQAVLRLGATANTDERAKHLIFNVKRSMSARASAGTSFTKRFATLPQLQERIDNYRAPVQFPMLLSLTELASLIAWPLGNPMVAGLPPVVARAIPPVEAVPRDGRVLGLSNMPGRERRVAVSFEDSLKHFWAVGATGSGKTVLLHNMFKQDIEADHGAFMIESKAESFKKVLDLIPPERAGDVIVLDLNNAHLPVGVNLLDQGNTEHVIDEITELFDSMYSSGSGLWSKAVFYNGLKAISTDPRLTLLDLGPLLSPQTPEQEEWRSSLISRIQDEDVRDWFRVHDSKPEAKRQQIVAPVIDRIWELSKPKIKAVLGQSKSAFQFADAVRENKIVLINVAGVEPKTANIIGALMFNAYWYAVRTNPSGGRKPNFAYVDEFQRFLGLRSDFADMLATARSANLGLVLANQFVKQLQPFPGIQDAVLRNARSKVSFNAAGDESRTLADEFGSLVSKDDIARLGSYQAMVKVAIGGSVSPPFTMATNPPSKPYGEGAKIRGLSLSTYGKPAEDVAKEVAERRQAEAPTTTTGDERFKRWSEW